MTGHSTFPFPSTSGQSTTARHLLLSRGSMGKILKKPFQTTSWLFCPITSALKQFMRMDIEIWRMVTFAFFQWTQLHFRRNFRVFRSLIWYHTEGKLNSVPNDSRVQLVCERRIRREPLAFQGLQEPFDPDAFHFGRVREEMLLDIVDEDSEDPSEEHGLLLNVSPFEVGGVACRLLLAGKMTLYWPCLSVVCLGSWGQFWESRNAIKETGIILPRPCVLTWHCRIAANARNNDRNGVCDLFARTS